MAADHQSVNVGRILAARPHAHELVLSNAFGFGGTNFHAVLEEYAPRTSEGLRKAAGS